MENRLKSEGRKNRHRGMMRPAQKHHPDGPETNHALTSDMADIIRDYL